MDRNFSDELKKIIAESRIIALELGYDYVSITHIFIADCKLNFNSSIKEFAFESDSDFIDFFNQQKIDQAILIADDLPLTKDAEKVIRNGIYLWKKAVYCSDFVEPYHLFLAASLMKKSNFKLIFNDSFEINESLKKYYMEKKIIKHINKSFMLKMMVKLNLF